MPEIQDFETGCDPNCQRRLRAINSLYELYRSIVPSPAPVEKGEDGKSIKAEPVPVPECIVKESYKGLNVLHTVGVHCGNTPSNICEIDQVLSQIEPILGPEVRKIDLTKELTETVV